MLKFKRKFRCLKVKYKKCIPIFQAIGYKRMMQPTKGMFLGITPVSSVSNGLYFLTLPLVSLMRVIYTSKGMSKKFGCALYIRYALSIKNTVNSSKCCSGLFKTGDIY